jgi:hypothetical protein
VALAALVFMAGCSGEEAVDRSGTRESEQPPVAASPEPDTTLGDRRGGSDQRDGRPSARRSEEEADERPSTREPGGALEVGGNEADTVARREGARPEDTGSSFEEPRTGIRVARAYVCKGIEESEPTEAGRSFIPAEDGDLRLCCFSEIEGAGGRDTILHIWYWGDREMARVELEVRGPSWRTWSSKRIADEWRGQWHVDITDSSGAVLKRLDFSVE